MRHMSTGLGQMYAAIPSCDKNFKSSHRKGGTFQISLEEGLQLPLLFLTHIKMQIKAKVGWIYLAFETAEYERDYSAGLQTNKL